MMLDGSDGSRFESGSNASYRRESCFSLLSDESEEAKVSVRR
jgi:hypothetical protein